MFRGKMPEASITLPRKVLDAIFNECDKYEADETGGRIVGFYQKKGRRLHIDVLGIIGPGPNARRTPTSLFQDGDYQEAVFRELEKQYPTVEHLGSWHTHHVNGLHTLSSGDRSTYVRTVNHRNHNTDFFYALLVVRKSDNPNWRYEIKHYLALRNDDEIHEISSSQVRVVEEAQSPALGGEFASPPTTTSDAGVSDFKVQRVKDQEFFAEFYPHIRPAFSKQMGSLYWKGEVALIDGSTIGLAAIEMDSAEGKCYSVTLTSACGPLPDMIEHNKRKNFSSARRAVWHLIDDLNRELYRRARENV